MAFPLADWIEAHEELPHNLGVSGMVGQLRSLPRALARRPHPDPAALREELARLHGVEAERVFLTHGATEGNALALSFLARATRRRTGRAPRRAARRPEYPPLLDVAELVGFRPAPPGGAPDVAILSHPNNPTGRFADPAEFEALTSRARRTLVDEVFREFSGRPSLARQRDRPGLWVVGSFTKAYGADDLRVGFVIPCAEDREAFDRHHGLLLDRLPPPSIAGALALLAARAEVLGEARSVFRRNLAHLRRRVRGVPRLDAPVWFDRGRDEAHGDRLAKAAAARGVLVCPGAFFGDPSGVRVCLTRRSFPADLDAYLEVRASALPHRAPSVAPRRVGADG